MAALVLERLGTCRRKVRGRHRRADGDLARRGGVTCAYDGAGPRDTLTLGDARADTSALRLHVAEHRIMLMCRL